MEKKKYLFSLRTSLLLTATY